MKPKICDECTLRVGKVFDDKIEELRKRKNDLVEAWNYPKDDLNWTHRSLETAKLRYEINILLQTRKQLLGEK